MRPLHSLSMLLLLALAVLALIMPFYLLLSSGLLEGPLSYLQEADHPSIEGSLRGLFQARPSLPPDAARYYELKGASCSALSEDFQIMTREVSEPGIRGLVERIPQEKVAADVILSPYRFEGSSRLYVKGDWMKRVEDYGSGIRTTIWKGGRVYTCDPGCSMRIMDQEESDMHYGNLHRMRQECAHLGGVALPPGTDEGLLLHFSAQGPRTIGGMRCELFHISVNRTYAREMLLSGALEGPQRALLWGMLHLEGPLEECLDESTGLTVKRALVLDLTDYYLFDYLPGGGMSIRQDVEMTYFASQIPGSFFDLPS